MVLCQVLTAEYPGLAQPCGLTVGLVSVVCVPGQQAGKRLSHYPECVVSEMLARPTAHPSHSPGATLSDLMKTLLGSSLYSASVIGSLANTYFRGR